MKFTELVSISVLAVVCALAPETGRAEPLPVQTITFEAPSVGRQMLFNLILPAGYEQSETRYPVLYLLHGRGGNYKMWAGLRVPEYAEAYEMIIVMPDTGNSWCVNWATSEEGSKDNWGDYIAKDLVGYVDSHYRTIARREGRAINGLSMGGFGALAVALKHPELFASTGSHSGALRYMDGARREIESDGAQRRDNAWMERARKRRSVDIEGFGTVDERTPKGRVATTLAEVDAIDPYKLVLEVPAESLPDIYIDCGLDDRLMASSRELATLLTENDITFTFRQSPGGHTGAYWSREVRYSMAHQYQVLSRLLAGEPPPRRGATGAQGNRGRGFQTVDAFLKRWLGAMDPNGDGKVHRDEATGAMKDNFEGNDVNNDGFIDRAEMEALANRLIGNRTTRQ